MPQVKTTNPTHPPLAIINQLRSGNWQSLVQWGHNKSVISLQDCCLRADEAPFVAKALSQLKMATLSLVNQNLGVQLSTIRDKSKIKPGQLHTSDYREALAQQKTPPSGVEQIVQALPSCVRVLDLSRNYLGQDGIAKLFHALKSTQVRALRLQRCAIDDVSLRYLGGLCHACGIESLNIEHNPYSMGAVAEFAASIRGSKLQQVVIYSTKVPTLPNAIAGLKKVCDLNKYLAVNPELRDKYLSDNPPHMTKPAAKGPQKPAKPRPPRPPATSYKRIFAERKRRRRRP